MIEEFDRFFRGNDSPDPGAHTEPGSDQNKQIRPDLQLCQPEINPIMSRTLYICQEEPLGRAILMDTYELWKQYARVIFD